MKMTGVFKCLLSNTGKGPVGWNSHHGNVMPNRGRGLPMTQEPQICFSYPALVQGNHKKCAWRFRVSMLLAVWFAIPNIGWQKVWHRGSKLIHSPHLLPAPPSKPHNTAQILFTMSFQYRGKVMNKVSGADAGLGVCRLCSFLRPQRGYKSPAPEGAVCRSGALRFKLNLLHRNQLWILNYEALKNIAKMHVQYKGNWNRSTKWTLNIEVTVDKYCLFMIYASLKNYK
jgi:hypothetical protein